MQTYQVETMDENGQLVVTTFETQSNVAYKRKMRQKKDDEFVVLRELAYMRVSTADQDTALQKAALLEKGCTVFFRDEWSGTAKHRPGLDAMMAQLRPGDRVNVWKVDRLGRSTIDSLDLVAEMSAKGVAFRSVTQDFDTATSIGRFIMRVLMIFAEFERENIVERVLAGQAAAREKGIYGGRRRSLDGEQVAAAREAWANRPINPATGRKMSTSELAKLFNVSRPCLRRWADPTYFERDTQDARLFRERHADVETWITETNHRGATNADKSRCRCEKCRKARAA